MDPGKIPSSARLSVSDTRFTVHWEIVPVPEPQGWMLFLAGLLPFALRRVHRKHALH
jgi:hypothetical protein